MTENREESRHPRLMMLAEFEGEIDGELKFHKSLYQYRDSHPEIDKEKWPFAREERGPTDRGFSSVIQSYEDLELIEEDNSKKRRDFSILPKGERVANGVRRGLSKLDPQFENRLHNISLVAEKNKDRSGSEIVEDESIQEAKEETYQSKL